ncbi:hypothetical protein [Actinocorallia aurantiaca]
MKKMEQSEKLYFGLDQLNADQVATMSEFIVNAEANLEEHFLEELRQ